MITKKDREWIADQFDIVTLENSSLEQIADEIKRTSDCIVIEVSKQPSIAFLDGVVCYSAWDAHSCEFEQKVTFRKFIKESQFLEPEKFCKNARILARMLNAAADRFEKIPVDHAD